MKIEQSPVKRVGDHFEREIHYQLGTKKRREIFCGRTRDEVNTLTAERVTELEQS